MNNRASIARFLHYGFLPEVSEDYRDPGWSRIGKDEVRRAQDVREEDLIEPALEAFHRAIRADLTGRRHIVPLSGGVDSRFLLATLVDHGLRDSIIAVTFGIPGTFDFDIAPRVARTLGVRHEAVDLTTIEFGREAVLGAVRRAPWTVGYEALFNHLVPARFGQEAVYWSGWLANSMAGIDVAESSETWEIARRCFASNCRLIHSTDLTPPGYDAVEALPDRPLLEDSCLTYYEQLFMFLRHPLRNRPALIPEGYDYRIPFGHPEWVEFILRVPQAYRLHQSLYYRMVEHAYPKLFALPTKNRLGLRLHANPMQVQFRRAWLKAQRTLRQRFPMRFNGTNPKLNYADFDRALREHGALRDAACTALTNLQSRGLVDWVDISRLMNAHLNGRENHGHALIHLAVLEWNLEEVDAGRSPVTFGGSPVEVP